jgi:hypothetical protein
VGAASNFFVTVSAPVSWAQIGPVIEKARAALRTIMVRIFMGFVLLSNKSER